MLLSIPRRAVTRQFAYLLRHQQKQIRRNKMSAAQERILAAMPPQILQDKPQQILKKKKKASSYIPGTVTLQVLGAGANGAPAAVYLFTDQSRYLFNCGEGTQRLAHEHKTKLSRLEQIFLTRNTWATIGGFPGLALTVQDAGVREMALHGPPHLDQILHSMKRFVVLKAMQVTTHDCTQSQYFEDSVMSVRCVPLYARSSREDAPSDEMVAAYVCKLKPRPGALNLEKCVAHGVPPGPLLGQLKNGVDVTLKNGVVVRSQDVSEAPETALSFVVLDIPSAAFLPALEAQASLLRGPSEDPQGEVAFVLHFTPASMLDNNCYQSFTQQFPAHTQHIYLQSPANMFSGYTAAHRIQYQLNLLNGRIFPLLAESKGDGSGQSLSSTLKKTKLSGQDESSEDNGRCGQEAVEAEDRPTEAGVNSLTSFHIRPRKGLDRSLEAKLCPADYLKESLANSDFSFALQALKTTYKSISSPSQATYPRITFLGTGSCIPNKTRNVSAILVQLHEGGANVLLDCGEGTLGQIVRFFGAQQAEEVVRNLVAIYVSHLHADHHIGLIGLLNERRRLLSAADGSCPKVLLLAPRQIQSWLDFYDERIENINAAYELMGNGDLLDQPLALGGLPSNAGAVGVKTCLVRHCPHSFGVSLTLYPPAENAKPFKITYSGDSMPCQDLVDLGRDSTILIHEATMEDDLVEEAKIKMHSTISQAIQQGRDMGAEHIILTHFSQRYAKLPRMQNLTDSGAEAEAETNALRNISIAFDNMQVSLEDLEHFHVLYPALKALFAEHADELDQKAMKRELKLERKRKLLESL